MSELERIHKYIERTNFPTAKKDYYMPTCQEIAFFRQEIDNDPFDIILTIFSYGRAKGFRAARRAGK